MPKPYAYRGFMLDTARHYMPVEDICRILRGAAQCGMNTMHWHLTDDQGWRLEIKRYPLLTTVGARRGRSHFWYADPYENNCGYYTQEDARRVVAFAKSLGVEIVPEIEIPGHASAMLAAYPQFGCRRTMIGADGAQIQDAPYDYQVADIAGVFPNLICAGRTDAVMFLKNILDEVADLFPGPFVHIGGDEAIKLHWRRCPDCQKRMRDRKLKDENALQRDLVLEIGAYLAEKGKKTIVWNEALDGGLLPSHFIVQHWWGNDRETADFLASGGQVIRSDIEHYYVSRMYFDLDLRGVWEAPALPSYAREQPENLLGMECCLWTEQITNPARAAYMLFPRLSAIALQAQRGGEQLPWEELVDRMRQQSRALSAQGLEGAPESLWRMDEKEIETEKEKQAQLQRREEMQSTWRLSDTLLRQEKLERLLHDIKMPYPFALRVMDFAFSEIPEYRGALPETTDDKADVLSRQLISALISREKGPWQRLPQEVWQATMGCFSRFVKETYRAAGRYAFDRDWWTSRQVEAKLFRLGELEYEMLENDGEKWLSLHIPSDARLESALLNASVSQARAFFRDYFPPWANAPIRCESWLLSPALPSLLPENARILRFQRAFDRTGAAPDTESVLIWVFQLPYGQTKKAALHELPEKTALQRSMKRLLLSGKGVDAGIGVLARPFQ